MEQPGIEAVLWDFGGVILSSPFEAFNRYETSRGLPLDFIRRINAVNPDSNAWARLERNEITPAEFDSLFGAESEAAGHRIPGADVLSLLSGEIRPEMVAALAAVRGFGYRTACLTNNVLGGGDHGGPMSRVLELFDAVIESSRVGVRKPEVRFYEIACETLGVEPSRCVFLDDLGVNLKPAAAMGMHTIKVGNPRVALDELSAVLGRPLG